MPNTDNYISLTEYAKLHGVDAATVRQKILRGNLPGAVKIGRNWAIPKDTEYTDMRRKNDMKTYDHSGCIHSDYGFYIGDPAYALSDHVYQEIWGKALNWAEGRIFTKDLLKAFAVAGTGVGDALYRDNSGFEYAVDSGALALIPLEMVEKADACRMGAIIQLRGVAEFAFKDCVFRVKLPDGRTVTIDAREK